MNVTVIKKDTVLYPDKNRVIARYFYNGDQRAREIIRKVIHLSDEEVQAALHQTLREFSKRHRNISKLFKRHFNNLLFLFADLDIDPARISEERKLLIGSFCTHEFSVEAAALFNPSIVEDPDQSGLSNGEKRVILSLRSTGEGHISSIIFRRGILDSEGEFTIQPPGHLIEEAEMIRRYTYDKESFLSKLREMDISPKLTELITEGLPDQFVYRQLVRHVSDILKNNNLSPERHRAVEKTIWLADAHYEVSFSLDTDISGRVIFPVSETERKGIEDARFVRFRHDDGKITYYATYTAFDGVTILPKLLQTKDFYNFKIIPLHGPYASNKNLALFPRKINGKYAMLSRVDGVNNYIMFSDLIHVWEDAKVLQEPMRPWEFIQVGNCGSPIETDHGWILITHGVGPMRKYCIGVSLLDLEDPSREIGRLKEPLIVPDEDEREGYVPNVVYTCGSIIHKDELIIPYAMSDYCTGFANVQLQELLEELVNGQ
jgi:predicted GH43/DUF377 family glycosyl hydrolase